MSRLRTSPGLLRTLGPKLLILVPRQWGPCLRLREDRGLDSRTCGLHDRVVRGVFLRPHVLDDPRRDRVAYRHAQEHPRLASSFCADSASLSKPIESTLRVGSDGDGPQEVGTNLVATYMGVGLSKGYYANMGSLSGKVLERVDAPAADDYFEVKMGAGRIPRVSNQGYGLPPSNALVNLHENPRRMSV